MNQYGYYENGEWCLDDAKIIKQLRKLSKQYENGEIVEVRDELHRIIKAIDTFTEQEN